MTLTLPARGAALDLRMKLKTCITEGTWNCLALATKDILKENLFFSELPAMKTLFILEGDKD